MIQTVAAVFTALCAGLTFLWVSPTAAATAGGLVGFVLGVVLLIDWPEDEG